MPQFVDKIPFTGWVILGFLAGVAHAQTPAGAAADTTLGWKRQFSGLLNLSQAYYDNWVKGGTDALTWEVNLAGSAVEDQTNYKWENRGKVIYGMTKIQSLTTRKSSDEWNLETVYTRKLGAWVNPFVSATALSQFTRGFKYNDSADTREQISDFFDPAFFTETIGVGISPIKNFTERIGFAMKQTVSEEFGFADDKETAGEVEDFKQEYGMSSVTEYSYTLMENILATTRLEGFTNFKGMDEVDGRWSNLVSAKVNKLISVNFELELLYDKDLSEDTQTRQNLAVSIAFLSL